MRQPISVQDDSTACFSGGRTLVMRQPSITRSSVAPANPRASDSTIVQASRCAGSAEGNAGKRGHDAELRDDDPAARRPNSCPNKGGSYLSRKGAHRNLNL